MERLARANSDSERGSGRNRTFWLHVGSFGLYNGFIGYPLHEQLAAGVSELLFFVAAIGLHLAVIEYGLQHHHEGTYAGLGQWILATAVVLGTGVGYVVDLGTVVTGFVFAFLAGGIVLNVVKEELPENRRSRYWLFAVSAAVYAMLLDTS